MTGSSGGRRFVKGPSFRRVPFTDPSVSAAVASSGGAFSRRTQARWTFFSGDGRRQQGANKADALHRNQERVASTGSWETRDSMWRRRHCRGRLAKMITVIVLGVACFENNVLIKKKKFKSRKCCMLMYKSEPLVVLFISIITITQKDGV